MSSPRRPWRGRRVLITSGPTHEPIDPIRYFTNASTGAMGFALAKAASQEGARVTVVTGPTALTPPRGVSVVGVVTALEMRKAVLARCGRADVVIGAAAVSDWRVAKVAARKIKRSARPLKLTLIPNPDIIREVSRRRRKGSRQVVVGFALETQGWRESALLKLKRKGLDLIVANGPENLGSKTAGALVLSRITKKFAVLPRAGKEMTARRILRLIEPFLQNHG